APALGLILLESELLDGPCRTCQLRTRAPFSLLRYIKRMHLVFIQIKCLDNGQRGLKRNLMFSRLAPVDQAYANFVAHNNLRMYVLEYQCMAGNEKANPKISLKGINNVQKAVTRPFRPCRRIRIAPIPVLAANGMGI